MDAMERHQSKYICHETIATRNVRRHPPSAASAGAAAAFFFQRRRNGHGAVSASASTTAGLSKAMFLAFTSKSTTRIFVDSVCNSLQCRQFSITRISQFFVYVRFIEVGELSSCAPSHTYKKHLRVSAIKKCRRCCQ